MQSITTFFNDLLTQAPWLTGAWLRITVILLLLAIGLRLARAAVRRVVGFGLAYSGDDALRLLSIEKRRATLVRLLNAVLAVALTAVSVLMIGRELDFDIMPILASAGVAGIAIGFGAQSLVKDVINGGFIILENQFDIGDVVKIAGHDGLVEEINLRTTVLRDLSGTAHIIPNGQISTVSVMTKGWSRLVFDIDVAYGEDLDRVFETLGRVLDEYARSRPAIVIEPPQILGVESLGQSAVTVRAVVKTVPTKQWEAGRELRKLVKTEFGRVGIEIPFPQRTVWLQQPPPPAVTTAPCPSVGG